MNQLHNAFTLFMSLLVEAMPFLLLGVVLSSLLLVFIDERQLITKLPHNPVLGSLIGSCIGFLFPVCECGNVPVARRLLMQGVPSSVAIGFLLAAPTINPIVIWSTWVAFRDQPAIVLLRVLFSLIIAIVISLVFGLQKDPQPLLQPLVARRRRSLMSRFLSIEKPQPVSALLQSGTYFLGQSEPLTELATAIAPSSGKGRSQQRRDVFVNNVVQELRELGGMLILGSAIAALIQVFVPRELVLSLGQGTLSSVVTMMLLAALVSICSTVDAFFALSFAATFTTGSLLAFLVFGPLIDLKSIGLMLSIFKPRIVLYLFVLAAQLTFILALSYSYFL
ncbi:MAG: permease [Cyanophyceae cyanobacterium]